MNQTRSLELFERALKIIPGGVNSPVRAFKSVGGTPLFIKKGKGAYIWDVDENAFIDYVGSWGPFILGHAHPRVIESIDYALRNMGTSFGAPTEKEIELAELISSVLPIAEKVRLVSSGTEATMSAIRVARGYTGKDKIVKFEGCYHGHGDMFLIKAGSGALTLGSPNSAGVTKGSAQDTLCADYNNIESVKDIVRKHQSEIAAIIIEPVAGNMGVVPADKNFLMELRSICDKENIVLIFDEVMSGFRVALGGACEHYQVTPDMVTLGKIIGGGLPVGAYAGKASIMNKVSPLGDVYQAGTLSGNPIAVSAGLETLKILKLSNPYSKLERTSLFLEEEFKNILLSKDLSFCINRMGSMISLFFTDQNVNNFQTAQTSDTNLFARFFHEMIDRGVYLPPSQFESWFVSSAHSEEDIEKTVLAFKAAITSLKN